MEKGRWISDEEAKVVIMARVTALQTSRLDALKESANKDKAIEELKEENRSLRRQLDFFVAAANSVMREEDLRFEQSLARK